MSVIVACLLMDGSLTIKQMAFECWRFFIKVHNSRFYTHPDNLILTAFPSYPQSLYMAHMILLALFASLLIITLTIPASATQTAHLFPPIIWSYWDAGFDSASLFTKLCLENKRRVAQKSGWDFRLLNATSIYDYLNRTQFDSVFERLWQKKPQKRANLLRLMLMIQYGGMWIDADTYFMRGLSWADSPDSSSYFRNKLEPNPQVIVGAYSQGQQTIVADSDLGKEVIVYPGLENWFLLSRPGTLFFQDMWQHLMEVITIGKDAMDVKIAQQNISFYPTYMNHYFFMSDYIEQVMMHRRQKSINQHSTPKEALQRYAVGQYGLWHFQAMETCFSHLKDYQNYGKVAMWFDLISYSPEEILGKKQQELPFFMKYVGWQYAIYDFFLEHHTTFNCWGLSHTIDPNSEIGIFLFSEANTQRLSDEVRPILEPLSGAEGYCRTHVRGGMERSSMRGVVWVVLYLLVPTLTLSVYVLVCWWGVWRNNDEVVKKTESLFKDDEQQHFLNS